MDEGKIQDGSIFENGYGIVPKKVMQDEELSIEAKAIYAYLCSYAGNKNFAFPSVDKIRYDLGISEKRFYKHINQLLDSPYMKKEKKRTNGKFERNVYIIVHNLCTVP